MKVSVDKQTPVAALAMLTAIATASYVRYAVAPYDNEMTGAHQLPPLAGWLRETMVSLPVLSVVSAVVMTVIAGMLIGQMSGRFNIHPSQTFLSMPLYGFMACGIFISGDAVSAAASSLLAAMALKYVCRGYLRERDLSAMLYAGLSIGTMLLVSVSGVVYVIGALSAIFILSFSARELFVLLTAMILPPLFCCYAVWALGGDFFSPLIEVRAALFAESGVDTFGNDAVAALTLCGLSVFVYVCSTVLFLSNRFMVSIKSRGILIYNIVLSLLSLAMFALPSSTPAAFSVAAVPMAIIMPVLFVREEERLSAVLYLSLWVVFILHLLYY